MKRKIRLDVILLLASTLTLCYTACALPVGADELTAGYHRTAADVSIPEFTFDYGMDMTDTLRAIGMTDVFDVTRADLSPMAEYAGGNLYCDYVIQKTRVELDRRGTRAAAVTFAAMDNQGMDMSSHTVILDRPFVFVITESSTGLPLFIGTVGNLS